MAINNSGYRYESDLVSDFINSIHLLPKHKVVKSFKEFDYQRGRADICALSSSQDLICIEAKLKNWKSAFHQAYKNTSYSHYSYILVPEKLVSTFENRQISTRYDGIGIISMGDRGLSMIKKAKKNKPIQPWLTKQAIELCTTGVN
jgi:hypothetical protein